MAYISAEFNKLEKLITELEKVEGLIIESEYEGIWIKYTSPFFGKLKTDEDECLQYDLLDSKCDQIKKIFKSVYGKMSGNYIDDDFGFDEYDEMQIGLYIGFDGICEKGC